MLEQLSIQNYALIDTLTIDFSQGLNILSGETGAGKSILVGALGLLLGEKGNAEAIREDYDEAIVSGVVDISKQSGIKVWLSEQAIPCEEETLFIRRVLKRSGRGAVTINSMPVSRTDLEGLCEQIFDLHSQHEHQSLLRQGFQRTLLDKYAGITADVESLGKDFQSLNELRGKLESLQTNENERQRELDILQFSINEIEAAQLKMDEESDLEKEIQVLSHAEILAESVEGFVANVSENRGGALAQLREAFNSLNRLKDIDSQFSATYKQFEDAFFELEDVTMAVKSYRDTIRFSPEELDAMQERLALIHRLEKKFGSTIPAVLEYAEQAKIKHERLSNVAIDKSRLESEIAELEKQLLNKAARISRARKVAAQELESKLTDILRTLGMEKSQMQVCVTQSESASGKALCKSYGFDRVEFLFSANSGVSPKSLRHVASGGELSRVMLAVKSVFADYDDIAVLVFDEIDTGIGGEIAVAVGQHLQGLGGKKQVLCITHLASIAARGDKHLKVQKLSTDNGTKTNVIVLNASSRVEEVARMLAGDSHTDVSLVHAKDLLERYSRQSSRS